MNESLNLSTITSFTEAYSNVVEGGFDNVEEGLVVGAESVYDNGLEILDELIKVAINEGEVELGHVAQRLQA